MLAAAKSTLPVEKSLLWVPGATLRIAKSSLPLTKSMLGIDQ